jgi:hypothetical protein
MNESKKIVKEIDSTELLESTINERSFLNVMLRP